MDRVLHDLNYLRLDELSDEWVEGIYYAEFLEFGEIPSEYESILENIEIRSVFRKIMKAVNEWVYSDGGTSDEKSWATLSHEVKHRKLLALLAYYIDCGGKNIMSQEHRNTAILASRVYFNMLSIPGYKAYHIYHSQLFAQSLGCLSYPKILCENEDNYFNLKQLTNEVNSVLKELALFVQGLRAIIDGLQLNPTDMNFEDILSNLVEFTGGAIVNKLNIDKIELVHISRVIYEMIDILLCNLNAEPNPDAIQLLFKCLLPKLVAASVDNRSANNLVRASYVTYSGLVLTKYGKPALSGFITLLEHLCYTQDGLERAEVRSARVSLVVGLMSLLPQKSYRYIVRWILKLSTTAKIPHRHIAMELIAQLLNNDPEESAAPASTEQTPDPNAAPANVDENNLSAIEPSANQDSIIIDQTENQNSQVKKSAESQDVVFSDQDKSDNIKSENQDSSNTPKESHGVVDAVTELETPVAGPSGSQDATSQFSLTGNVEVSPSTPDNISLSELLPQNSDLASPVVGPLISPDSTMIDQNLITDSGIQDPTIGFDSECDDYIMSLFTNNQDALALGEIPGAIPELGNIEDFSLFGEMSYQPSFNNETESNQNAGDAVNKEVNLAASVTANVNEGEENKKGENIKGPDGAIEAQKSASEVVNGNQERPNQGAASTDDESSQEPMLLENPEQVSAEEMAGLLRQRPHTVSHAELLRALYERVHDVSGTLRTRALAILTDALASARAPLRRAVTELNGDGSVSRLMVAAARCVSDERAAVRRAAVALVHRSLAAGDPPAPADLGILVSLCRDASIVVRAAAIAALGELVVARPAPAALDAFLAGPLHQLGDPETKIQEQVVTLVQQVAIDRLQKRSAGAEDQLPWMFLAAVTRHNMRRHLQKACSLLFKMSKCINHRMVDAVSTHLGAGAGDARDLQALVLLTSAARLLDYSDVQFLLDYYYSLADCAQERDQRLMPLTAELLTLWARYVPAAARARLRDHLAARLAGAALDDGSRIPCAMLAAHLDPQNLQWANELLALSEKRALSGGVQEWLRAADVSLVAPAPPAPALLQLFLAALRDPPPEWGPAEQGAAAAGAGRLCVRSRGAAAAAAPVLAALLHSTAHAHIARVNALLALADICVRYTNIVEPLLESVCACLGAGAPPALRRAAARALTRLLLAGYLRLRTPLYYRYCALLADSDADVREPAEYFVSCCLPPDTIYHHFVDCVLHYNRQPAESISFDARQLIYDVMLQRMSLVQKLNIQCRLARDVLERAADMTDEQDGALAPAMSAALLDTITLLCGPRMKLPKKPQNQGDVADIDDLQERVTTNIVSHKMKRTVAEVVVPAVLRLHARVRRRGGQVAAYLVRIATDLLADYRQEISELIDNDSELVERVAEFQQNIGQAPAAGNARNLVTASAPPEPDTPRAPRRRARPPAPAPAHAAPPRKRALRV